MSPFLPRRGLLLRMAALSGAMAAGHALALPRPGAVPSAAMLEAWAAFRRGFLRPEGRVVDTGNGGVSHSEGQGWAMFCAERCQDRASFESLWAWTRRHLARPRDRLLAWRYVPGAANPVPDHNNATDGDLFAAAALLLAGERWSDPALTEAGAAMATDILRLLLRRVAGEAVLLPGAVGFEEADSVILNPSYYAFPVLGVLAQAVPDTAWLHLAGDGVALLRRARFGVWGLTPDWVAMQRRSGDLSLPDRWPGRFSYDAVRVPLYLRWAGLGEEPAVHAAAAFWRNMGGPMPAWVDLRTHEIAPYPASGGMRDVARLVSGGAGSGPKTGNDDYYSSVLKLLARCAEFSSA